MSRALFFTVLMFMSCGKKEDDDPPPVLEVSNLTATSDCNGYVTFTSTITFTPSLSGSSAQQIGWEMVTVLKEGESAPADCKSGGDKEYKGSSGYYWSDLKCATKYSLRACALRKSDGYLSSGLAKTITTSSKP